MCQVLQQDLMNSRFQLQVFPKCTETDFVVENILKVFDTTGDGVISIREILIAFAMSMKGSHREKLHWAFR